ncbi:MAG: hypothetical protein HY533_06905, partial [Chloroflexi bacterium]|nr:hypothetical protein [Chloroflexota bacterium]
GDLHPHLMSLPFLLAFLGLTLGYLMSPGGGLRWARGNIPLLVVMALVLGALGFINLWDLPVFGALLAATAVVKGYSLARKSWPEGVTPLLAAIGVVALAVALYLPFLFGFQSQANGVLPVETYVSRPFHLFLVWGLFLVILVVFLLWELASALGSRAQRWKALATALLIALSPWALWALAEGVRLWDVGEALKAAWQRLLQVGPLVALMSVAGYLALWLAREARRPLGEGAVGDAVQGKAVQVEAKEPVVVTIGTESVGEEVARVEMGSPEMAGAVVRDLTGGKLAPETEGDSLGLAGAYPFVLLGMAALLVMGPELFRVADLFGNRMNTMFKLSYQAWALLALASSYALYSLVARFAKGGALGRLFLFAWLGVVATGMVASLYYPAAAAYTKAAPSKQATLDGLAYVARSAPGEYQAIQWLRRSYRDGEVMVEAVGDDYSDYGRVSASTGVPTVLGWTFHEEQWRGSRRPFEGRQEAVRRLYQTGDVGEAKAILEGYGVTYIYIGSREHSKYGSDGLAKFGELGAVAFQEGDVVIYRVGE